MGDFELWELELEFDELPDDDYVEERVGDAIIRGSSRSVAQLALRLTNGEGP